jgi:RimJ/RimL family protein N-acetyltransferase
VSEHHFVIGSTPAGVLVRLRALELTDIDRCLKWINDPVLRQTIAATYPMSRYAEEKWLARLSDTKPVMGNPTDMVFAIVVEDQHVGTAGIHSISMVHRHAITGMMIGEATWRGKGVGPTAKKLVIDYAFEELNLERLQSIVIEGNIASIKMQERHGYQLVGRLPKWNFKDGQWKDDFIYVLDREHWRKSQSSS